jgi:NLI interacting factor-like phosphatase
MHDDNEWSRMVYLVLQRQILHTPLESQQLFKSTAHLHGAITATQLHRVVHFQFGRVLTRANTSTDSRKWQPGSTRISTLLARRFLLGSTAGGLSAYGTYKAAYDPLHLVWDLDNTILCSVSPLPITSDDADDRIFDSFDQIDDDFPVDNEHTPNTRTYWRPGARTALSFCSLFAIQHVYTTAQSTYTSNVLDELDPNRTFFHTVIHRDMEPASVQQGKDLSLIEKSVLATAADGKESSSSTTTATTSLSLMNRIVLLDDRVKNFAPQDGQNGIHVFPFQVQKNGSTK